MWSNLQLLIVVLEWCKVAIVVVFMKLSSVKSINNELLE